jgi:integrase
VAKERHDARQALLVLREAQLDISLTEAARIAVRAHGQPAQRRPGTPIDTAIDAFLRRCLEMKLRAETYGFYEYKLNQFSRRFPEETLDDVTRPRLAEWLHGMPVAPGTRKGTLRAVHALYSWARSKEPPLCAANSCEGLRIEVPKPDRSPTILHAREVRAVLEGAGPYRHAVALGVFAGIRPDELAGEHKPAMTWSLIDWRAKRVRVPVEIAKTRAPRIIERMPAALWAWLEDAPRDKPEGRICPAGSRQIPRRLWPIVQPLRPDLQRWPEDVLRHTAASYLLAYWDGDSGRVSRALGWEGDTEVLFARYAATMTKAQASAIAALRPPAAPEAQSA